MDIEFLASLSHELKTPLNSLLILSQQLSENAEGNLTSKQIEFAKTIFSCGDDLNDLINDILDLSKIKKKVLTADFHPVSIKETVLYLESLFTPAAEAKKLKFYTVIDEDTPEFLETDNIRLNQILKNLISNSIKFTEQGEISLKIRVSEKKLNHPGRQNEFTRVVSFSVQDTGIGIPPEKNAKIFEAFNQTSSHGKKQYTGTGLGLFISKGLAELLGGQIEMQSETGIGSIFTLFVPVEAAPNKKNKAQFKLFKEEHESKPEKTTARLTGEVGKSLKRADASPEIKILIIDDLKENLDSIESIFRDTDYKFFRSQSGKEALKILLENQDISLILTDVQMPEMDGFETASMIFQHESLREIPIIFISAYSFGDANLFKGYEYGAVDYIFKPINPQILKIKVSIFVELFRKNHLLKQQEEKLIRINTELHNEINARISFENELKFNNQQKMKASFYEKELLLKEIYHRVKNNLQVISSLLNLQAGYIEDDKIKEIFIESRNRILSMALVHEKLYKFNDLSKIDFGEYIEDLSRNLLSAFHKTSTVECVVDKLSEVFLDIDRSIPLGLCINELITNSLRHAFPENRPGKIVISVKKEENVLYLSISDDGIGIADSVVLENLPSLGMQLVYSLIDQLNGTISLERHNKTEFKLEIPLTPKKEIITINKNAVAYT